MYLSVYYCIRLYYIYNLIFVFAVAFVIILHHLKNPWSPFSLNIIFYYQILPPHPSFNRTGNQTVCLLLSSAIAPLPPCSPHSAPDVYPLFGGRRRRGRPGVALPPGQPSSRAVALAAPHPQYTLLYYSDTRHMYISLLHQTLHPPHSRYSQQTSLSSFRTHTLASFRHPKHTLCLSFFPTSKQKSTSFLFKYNKSFSYTQYVSISFPHTKKNTFFSLYDTMLYFIQSIHSWYRHSFLSFF